MQGKARTASKSKPKFLQRPAARGSGGFVLWLGLLITYNHGMLGKQKNNR